MRKMAVLVCLLLSSAIVFAQETPQVEVFGGYSYLRSGGNFNGWNAAATFNRNDWLGITAEFGGNYASQSFHFTGFPNVGASAHLHTFTFGPTLTYRKDDRFTPFAHLLLGGAHLGEKVNIGGITESEGQTGIGLVLGGGIDIPTNDHWAIRPQMDYVGSHFTGGWVNSLRISAGLVYRWGSR